MKRPKTILTVQLFFLPLVMFLLTTGCTPPASYKYKIGVSQCVGGKWRDKVNNEMLSSQHLYDTDVKVCITNADNNTNRQRQQIDSLIDAGVDLLVIAPNEYKPLSSCVERAKKRGIPVILFERTFMAFRSASAQGKARRSELGWSQLRSGAILSYDGAELEDQLRSSPSLRP